MTSLDKTLIEEQESSSTHVKITNREEVRCPVLEADHPLAEGSLLLEQRAQERRARPPTTRRAAAVRTARAEYN